MTADRSIADRARQALADQLRVPVATLSNELTFVGDLGCDSLDSVEALMALEDEFETEIADEDAERVTTVGEAIAMCERLLSAKAA